VAVLLPSLTLTLAALLAATVLLKDLKNNDGVTLGVWIIWPCFFIYLMYRMYTWLESKLVVTDKRILVTTAGLLVRRSGSVSISKVTSWGFRDSFGGLLLRERGYKSLVLQSDGHGKGARTIGWIPLDASRRIGTALPSDAWNGMDEEAFKEWAPGGLVRRLRLVAAVALVCSIIIAAVVVASHPHIQAELSDQSDVIALFSGIIPIIIALITP
jgi:hypothetical protein